MKTGALLVNWHNPEDTLACLESLRRGRVAPDRILVWDNDSAAPPHQLAGSFPEVEWIAHPDNLGFAEANNRGARLLADAGMDLIWILNNDTEVEPGCLEALRAHLQAHPDCAGVTGRILYHADPDRIWYAGGAFRPPLFDTLHLGMGTSDRERVDAPGPVDFISGCCLLLRREVFEAHGLYDAAFFAYDEDADWCLRMRARGLRLDYTPAARLRHKVSASLRKQDPGQGTLSPLQHYFQTRNRLWILRRHGGSSLRSFWLRLRFSLRVLRYAAANLLLGRPTKTRAILRGLRDGWRGVA